MTVKVSKPALNLREKISELTGKQDKIKFHGFQWQGNPSATIASNNIINWGATSVIVSSDYYDTATGGYTIPESGIYNFQLSFGFYAPGTGYARDVVCAIRINGVNYFSNNNQLVNSTGSNDHTTIHVSGIKYCTKGEIAYAYIPYADVSGVLMGGGAFGAFKIN